MSVGRQSQDMIRQHLAEELDWRLAQRNDQAVALALYGDEAVEGVHTLDEAGLLDGFFAFLKEAGMVAVWHWDRTLRVCLFSAEEFSPRRRSRESRLCVRFFPLHVCAIVGLLIPHA